MRFVKSIQAVDSHTMGEPTRIVTGGIPSIKGNTMPEKKAYLENNMDYIRTAIMHEPRGHKDMFGSIITAPTKEELVGNNEVTDWSNGDFVLHDTFGKGVVVKVNGNTLDIAFELPAGLKTLMANHKALKKLTN